MNLRELKLLNSKTCCGYEFTANDITKIEINKDYKFYGGRVQYYTVTQCPKCHKEVVLMLEAYDNSYRVIDIGLTGRKEEVEEAKEIVVQHTAIEEKPVEEKFICPNCNKEFKTKAGLGKHIKSCK